MVLQHLPGQLTLAVDLLIKAGRVVTRHGVIDADVAVDAGQIVAVGAVDDAGRQEIDATGLHVLPGLIDPHVHFNEPGRTDWEGLDTGSAALSATGGTCFFDMPLNSSPPVLDAESFRAKRKLAEAKSRTDFALWGGLTPTNLGRLEELADCGVVGFKAFMSGSGIDDFRRADDLTLYRGMQAAARRGLIVAVHAESESITSALACEARQRGDSSWEAYLASRPILAEVEAVQRAITLAAEAGCRLHLVHLSSGRAVERVRLAADPDGLGLDVSAETCPHYLTLTAADLPRRGAIAKCAPPLRSADECEKLWAALEDDALAFVASDHSPAPPAMKSSADAFEAWGGIAGVQSTLPILLSRRPPLPLPRIAQLTSGNVAARFGLPHKGQIAEGFDADLALVDLEDRHTLTREALLDRHRLSPYVGREFEGRVVRTLVRGQTVFHEGRADASFRGRLVTPQIASAAP